MIHDRHDGILIPPLRVLDALNLATHDDDLAGRDQLATAVSRSQMLWNTSWRYLAVEGLCETLDHFCPLSCCEGVP